MYMAFEFLLRSKNLWEMDRCEYRNAKLYYGHDGEGMIDICISF